MTVITTITEADVDASIARVIQSVESIWDEWAWQVENKTWLIKGLGSWDEMRRAVYSGLTSVTAPRSERPELVARFRNAGLTQQETADTLGVTTKTVKRDEHPEWKGTNVPSPADVVDAEVVEDEPPAASPAPKVSRDSQPPRASSQPDAALSLVNDVRLYLRTLAASPEVAQLSPTAKSHIISALQDAIDTLKGTDA